MRSLAGLRGAPETPMTQRMLARGVVVGGLVLLLALFVWAMEQRTRAARSRFVEAYELIAPGVSAQEVQRRLAFTAPETEVVGAPLSTECRERPRSQLILSDRSSRFTAIFYLDREGKVVCSALVGPMSD